MSLPSTWIPNNTPPYRHWHVLCGGCRVALLARPCCPPKPIEPLPGPLSVTCSACDHEQSYAPDECFLAPYHDLPRSAKKETGTVAVIAGMVAAVRLARVESMEIARGSPRVASAISDAVNIARHVLARVKNG